MRAGATAIAIVAAILIALPALAGNRWRLVLISDREAELTRRLRAEAADVGLELASPSVTSESSSPSAIAEKHGAVGVIRVSSPSTVELWIFSRHQQPSSYETLRIRAGEGELFAFRVVEEIRARLLELPLPDSEAAQGTPRPSDATTDAAQPPPLVPAAARSEIDTSSRPVAPPKAFTMAARAGLGVLTASGGMGTTVHGALAFRASLPSGFGATAQALLPLTNASVTEQEGSARIRTYVFAMEVDRVVWERASWSAAIGAGAGAVLLTMHGEPVAGYIGTDDRLTAAVFFMDARLGSELTRWLSVHGSLLAGVSAPRPVVRFDGHEAAAWGRPLAVGIIAFDFVLPVGVSLER